MRRTVLATVAILTASISATASASIQFTSAAFDAGAGDFDDLLAANYAWTCPDRSPWNQAGSTQVVLLTDDAAGYPGDLPRSDAVFPAVLSGPTATLASTPLLNSPPFELGDIATEEIAEPGALALLGLAVIGLAVAWAARRARRLRATGA